jgi:nucleoside-diphosphate-sugar epimerase
VGNGLTRFTDFSLAIGHRRWAVLKCPNMSQSLRVAVTGGSGSIGSQVIKQLLAAGHQAINIDRRQADEPLARFVFADVTRREQVQPILEQVDAVCHLGEIPNNGPSHSPDTIYGRNATAASAVLQSAADLKIQRVIYTSTCQVYGTWGDNVPPLRLPLDETHPLRPHNAYALSKASNEGFCHLVARKYGLSIAIFRFPAVLNFRGAERWYRRRMHDEGPTHDLQTYVGVDDAARAYVLALEQPRPGCEAYHFSAAEVQSAIPLRQRLAEYHPDFPPLPPDWPDFKSPMLCDKARSHFGWEPTWNLREEWQKFAQNSAPPR